MKKHKATNKDLQILSEYKNSLAAKLIGVSVDSAEKIRFRYKIKSPPAMHERQKLYAEDIAQMMMLRESGFCNADIARLKGIAAPTVSRAIKRAEQTGFDVYKKRGQ